MKNYFLDTGYLIALESAKDQHHKKAKESWEMLKRDSFILITTSYIFNEVVTYFNSLNKHDRAMKIGEMILKSNYISMLPVDKDLFDEGWDYFKKFKNKTYSFADCISFLIMQRHNINTALSFDKHFRQAGFTLYTE